MKPLIFDFNSSINLLSLSYFLYISAVFLSVNSLWVSSISFFKLSTIFNIWSFIGPLYSFSIFSFNLSSSALKLLIISIFPPAFLKRFNDFSLSKFLSFISSNLVKFPILSIKSSLKLNKLEFNKSIISVPLIFSAFNLILYNVSFIFFIFSKAKF